MTIKYNETSANVAHLQLRLGVTITGMFAAETVRAVIKFQGENRLLQDGIVGPKTMAALWPAGMPVLQHSPELIVGDVNLNILTLTVPTAELMRTVKAFATLNAPLTKLNVAHVLGQAKHESAGFTKFRENMNYSASRLLKIFPNSVKTKAQADKLAYNPQVIANTVYANRLGNGNFASGDGWNFRGAGSIMVTGRDNFEEMTKDVGDKAILTNTDLVANQYRMDAAVWFFSQNNIWPKCKGVADDTVAAVTRVIAPTLIGFSERSIYTKAYYTLLHLCAE